VSATEPGLAEGGRAREYPAVRLAHLADPHLGFRQFHRQTPGGLNQREADVAGAFRAAMDDVIAARPDAVVVAGDLFHAVRPTNAAIVFAFRQFQRLREALPDAPVILIAGNHDTPRSSETGSILRLFEELGVDVATTEPRRLAYPSLGLSVLAVPHQSLVGPERPSLTPEGDLPHQVLVLHGEIEGVFPTDRSTVEYGGASLPVDDLHATAWSYVALGHYHLQQEVAPRAWYAGALEYVSSNIWGERREEASRRQDGKGWLLVDLAAGTVARRALPVGRGIHDLDPLDAAGLGAADLDAAIAARLAAVPGGLTDQVVRLVVLNVPRHQVRELNHAALRAARAEALHLQVEFRRPDPQRAAGDGETGLRQTLPELLEEFLRHRPLPPEIDRDRFVREGVALLAAEEG
jgi:DNA repair exonuclease SbcCD nuclease subunit